MYPDPWVLGASLVLWRASCRLLGPPVGACYIIPWVQCSWARGRLRHDASISLRKNKTVAQMKSAVCKIQVCWLLADDVGVSMEVNK